VRSRWFLVLLGLAAVSCAPAPSLSFAPLPPSSPVPSLPATPASPGPTIDPGTLRGTIVYSSETSPGNTDVFRWEVGTDAPVRLTDGSEEEWDPDLSYDGTQIAYRRNPDASSDDADIWIMDSDGGHPRNLTNAPELANWAPAWNGRVGFSSRRGTTLDMELWTLDPAGGDPVRISEGWCEYAKPSPDGSAWICAGAVQRRYEIFVVNARTGERTQITDTPMGEFAPSWSPDGEWIAFSRDMGDRWALIIARPDGSDEREVAEEGVFSTWDPDGHLVWSGPGGINVANADGSGRVTIDLPADFISWRP
jgi:Tol biopolymer transport system component